MKNIKFTNLAVFIIFFEIALIEAFQKQNWLEATLFLALGVISLWADIRNQSIETIVTIGENIKKVRTKLRLTQDVFGEKIRRKTYYPYQEHKQ